MNIGDKVVCVDDNWSKCWADPRRWFSAMPVRDRVYVVRGSVLAPNGEVGITLIGINGMHYPNGQEAGFFQWRFRKLDEMKATANASVPATIKEVACW